MLIAFGKVFLNRDKFLDCPIRKFWRHNPSCTTTKIGLLALKAKNFAFKMARDIECPFSVSTSENIDSLPDLKS